MVLIRLSSTLASTSSFVQLTFSIQFRQDHISQLSMQPAFDISWLQRPSFRAVYKSTPRITVLTSLSFRSSFQLLDNNTFHSLKAAFVSACPTFFCPFHLSFVFTGKLKGIYTKELLDRENLCKCLSLSLSDQHAFCFSLYFSFKQHTTHANTGTVGPAPDIFLF